jgi:ribosomal protein L11 methyltransferase
MNWTELLIEISVDDLQVASDIASMAVPYGFYIEDYSDLEEAAWEIAHIDLIDEKLLKKDRTKAIIHIYILPDENPNEAVSFIKERFEKEKIKYKISIKDIKTEDWENNWKQYFKPTKIGNSLLILPLWMDEPQTDRKILRIDPGAAFGTGTHATTRLCMEALETCIKQGDSVLDIGCGSGILSIASMLLGAEKTVGIDIDALAVKTAVENGKVNNLTAPDYTVFQGDLVKDIDEKFDVCVANIVADVIIELCDSIKNYMKPGGYFITSGIIDVRADEVEKKLMDTNLEIIKRYENSGWVCFVTKIK